MMKRVRIYLPAETESQRAVLDMVQGHPLQQRGEILRRLLVAGMRMRAHGSDDADETIGRESLWNGRQTYICRVRLRDRDPAEAAVVTWLNQAGSTNRQQLRVQMLLAAGMDFLYGPSGQPTLGPSAAGASSDYETEAKPDSRNETQDITPTPAEYPRVAAPKNSVEPEPAPVNPPRKNPFGGLFGQTE